MDHVRTLAKKYPLDLSKVIICGHSAGGHLASWAACRHKLKPSDSLYNPSPLPIHALLCLAGLIDLEKNYTNNMCGGAVDSLIGGSPRQYPDRYQQGSPPNLLPIDMPIILLTGGADTLVPLWYSKDALEVVKSKEQKDVKLVVVPDQGHFEGLLPGTELFASHVSCIKELHELISSE